MILIRTFTHLTHAEVIDMLDSASGIAIYLYVYARAVVHARRYEWTDALHCAGIIFFLTLIMMVAQRIPDAVNHIKTP